MPSGAELRVDDDEPRVAGGDVLEGEIRCDVPGCPRLRGFRNKAGLGAHRWHAHGLRGGQTVDELPASDGVGHREDTDVGDKPRDEEPTEEDLRAVTVWLDVDDSDVLDAWVFLNGASTAEEWVASLVADAILQARRTDQIEQLVQWRRERRQ
jgi:hypothetical protein